MKTSNDKAADSVDGLSADVLGQMIAAIDGVEGLEVDLRSDGSPRLLVRLDGTVPSSEVTRRIRGAFGNPPEDTAERLGERRAGLGRGLADILAAEATATASQLFEQVPPEQVPKLSLALVAVEETVGGISVRAADSAGGVAFSPVEDTRSLNQAVVSAVGRLRQQRPLPRLAGVEIRDVDGAAVLTVVLALDDGKRSVGSALVEGGMPFTLGRAVWEALTAVG